MFGRKKRREPSVIRSSMNISEVAPKKKKRSKMFIFLYIVGFVFLVWASYQIISQGVKISEGNERLKEIQHQISITEIKISYQEKVKNYKGDELSEYIENIAREDLDYVKNGERVFVNISGD